MYQKAQSITKTGGINQKSLNLSWKLENIKYLQSKSTKSIKIIKTLGQTLQYWEMGLPIYQILANENY